LPHAFIDGAALTETAAAGTGTLPAVVPATEKLTVAFRPLSGVPWLTIGAVTNDVIHFSFTADTGATRGGQIRVLGELITVTQK